MNTDVINEGLIAKEEKISPVVIGATVIIIGLFTIGLLYQLVRITGFA